MSREQVRRDTARSGGEARRRLPSVDRLLHDPAVAALGDLATRDLITTAARAVIEDARVGLASEAGLVPDDLPRRVVAWVQRAIRPSLRGVINATGVVLHTNLGRAPLSRATQRAMQDAARGYSTLEYDLEAGGRGSRHVHVEALLQRLTGADAALVVNNNAAAMLLVLASLAAGREVIVSRGQAVEIGGGFRIPDVLAQSGARLVDVGTTNRTRLDDYAEAIEPATALLLRVHASNFRITGFTESVPLAALVALGRQCGVTVVDDLGSGCLLDTTPFGIGGAQREPMPQESVAAGADVVCFSGDKLLGGPQAGLIVGRQAVLAQLRRHPLVRALRPDKVTIAGLVATLRHYERGEAVAEVPVWQMIAAKRDDLAARAQAWAAAIAARSVALDGEVHPAESAIGGGSLPGVTLPTVVLAVRPRHGSVDGAAAALRQAPTPVIARIEKDCLLFDPRTVAAEEEPALLDALAAL